MRTLALAAWLLAMPLSAQDDKLWRQLAIIENPGLFKLSETQDEFRTIIPAIAANCPDIDTAREAGDKAYTVWEDIKESGFTDGFLETTKWLHRIVMGVQSATAQNEGCVQPHGDVYVAERVRKERRSVGNGDRLFGRRIGACRCLVAAAPGS